MYEVKQCSKRIKAQNKNLPHQKIRDNHVHSFSFAETEEMFSNIDPTALAGKRLMLKYLF